MVNTYVVLQSPLQEEQLDGLFEWLREDGRIDTTHTDLERARRKADELVRVGFPYSFRGSV